MSAKKPQPAPEQPVFHGTRPTSPPPPRRRYSPSVHELDAANRIADRLFLDGSGVIAERLVLELPGKKEGGGWCRAAVVREIVKVLNNE